MASSVCVITYDRSDAVHGITVTSAIPLSLDPPLMGFALAKRGGSLRQLVPGTRFGLAVLGEAQQATAMRCAASPRGPVEEQLVDRDAHGTPVLRNGAAAFRLVVEEPCDAGDHVFIVARIESGQAGRALPLLYFDRDYSTTLP
jgi:flavin reductase (DIM6/NTAB) family NADH-FMN oxidoreductase RutF